MKIFILLMLIINLLGTAFGEVKESVEITKNSQGKYSYISYGTHESFAGLPGYSSHKGQVVYLRDDSSSATDARNLSMTFFDLKTLKTIKTVQFDVLKLNLPEEMKRLDSLNQELKSGEFEKMKVIATKNSDGTKTEEAKKLGLDFNYDSKTGKIEILDSKNKKVLLKEQFPKIQNVCGPGVVSNIFPNAVTMWVSKDLKTYLFSIASVGARDDCLDPSLMKVYLPNL